jgi:hypothetical protein
MGRGGTVHELDGRRLHRRIVGRVAIERSIRSLMLRVARFGQHRARSASDRLWSAAVMDSLQALLREPRADDTADALAEMHEEG